MYTPQERTNGAGERVVAGEIVTITTRDGDRVSGEVSFNPSSANTAVVRSAGYTYIGDVRTMQKGNRKKG